MEEFKNKTSLTSGDIFFYFMKIRWKGNGVMAHVGMER